MNCKNCGQPLIGIKFSIGLCYVCDNWRCYLYRQRQDLSLDDKADTGNGPPKYRSAREAYDAQRRENYQLLRNLGIPSREAANMTSNKQTRLVLAWKTEGIRL